MSKRSEIWKDILGYEGLYQVSNFGRLRSLPKSKSNRFNSYILKGRILKPSIRGEYLIIVLYKKDLRKTHCVNRLVATAFIPNPFDKPQTNHKNGNRKNNRVSNLEWATRSENIRHSYDILKRRGSKKSGTPSKVSTIQKTINGKFVKSYASIASASRNTGISRHHIGKCIQRKRKSAGGFLWV